MENVLLRQTRKNDTETQDDMAIWSFPSPEVSMISACPLPSAALRLGLPSLRVLGISRSVSSNRPWRVHPYGDPV